MAPAVIVAWLGLDPTRTLVISQVVLNFVLPIPVIALIVFTRRRDVMGTLVNRRTTTLCASVCAAVILLLNVLLIYQTGGGHITGLF